MKNIKAFTDFSQEYIPQIDSLINDYYQGKTQSVSHGFMADMYRDLLEYLGRDGKRIRPLLLLASYLGYAKGKKNTGEMMNLASSLELMHAMLLVQDDIIDKAPVRRGGAALHLEAEKYASFTGVSTVGHDVALVLGDILFANALELVSRADICNRARNRFLGIFSSTYEMTAWGQIMDSLHSMPKKLKVSDNIPLAISTLKTAHYTIYYPILMGHVLAGPGKEEEMETIRDFAIPLGLAFQIRDDILGSFGIEEDTGKPAEADLREGKLTLLVQETIENLKKSERTAFMDLLMKEKKTKKDVSLLKKTIRESDALDRTVSTLNNYSADSRECLNELKVAPKIKDVFFDLIVSIETFEISET